MKDRSPKQTEIIQINFFPKKRFFEESETMDTRVRRCAITFQRQSRQQTHMKRGAISAYVQWRWKSIDQYFELRPCCSCSGVACLRHSRHQHHLSDITISRIITPTNFIIVLSLSLSLLGSSCLSFSTSQSCHPSHLLRPLFDPTINTIIHQCH